MTLETTEFGDDLDRMTIDELRQKVKELQEIITDKGLLDKFVVPADQYAEMEAKSETVSVLQEPDVQMIKFFLDVRKSMDKKQKIRLIASNGIVKRWELA